MTKKYLIVYEYDEDNIFKKVYDKFTSKKEALNYFKDNNPRYKVVAIRDVTSGNIYL